MIRPTPMLAISSAAPTGSSPKMPGLPAVISIALGSRSCVGGGLVDDVDHLAQLGRRSLAGEEPVAESTRAFGGHA